jgi:SWI/SNF-related matrix-associated actin-dependent regulator of chromatin subfamily A-like protein 1
MTQSGGNLTIRDGAFHLSRVDDGKLRARLYKDPRWKRLPHDSFSTTNLAAATERRKDASPKVERFFKKTFQEFYPFETVHLPLSGIDKSLDPHQKKGIEWILTRKRSYLAHAPGAGKTAEAVIASSLVPGPGAILFIVPPSLTLNWAREIWKFTEWLGIFPTIGIVPTKPYQWNFPERADYIICPDSLLSRDWVQRGLLGRAWKFIAVDEASRFKTHDAERSIAFYGGRVGKKTYPGIFQHARHVVFLDGSPMPNRPMELFAPTYALDPQTIDCMDRDDFGYRYCGAKPNERGQWEYNFSSHEDELHDRMQKTFMHFVGEESLTHPERLRSMVYMSEDVRSPEHRKWERKNLGSVELSDANTQGDLARFRRELGMRKVPWVSNYVKERLREKKESILVFCWHREVAFRLAEELVKYKPRLVIGGISAHERERAFKGFDEKTVRCLIINIAAGGRGHNLQRADRVIFAEWSWTDETNRQCEKRASRKGSTKEFVRCEYVVCPNSMDEVVLSSVFAKEKRVKKVIG